MATPLRIGFDLGAFESLDEVVAQVKGIAHGLQREGMRRRTRNHIGIHHHATGHDQVFVRL
jgi:hypothetical protein